MQATGCALRGLPHTALCVSLSLKRPEPGLEYVTMICRGPRVAFSASRAARPRVVTQARAVTRLERGTGSGAHATCVTGERARRRGGGGGPRAARCGQGLFPRRRQRRRTAGDGGPLLAQRCARLRARRRPPCTRHRHRHNRQHYSCPRHLRRAGRQRRACTARQHRRPGAATPLFFLAVQRQRVDRGARRAAPAASGGGSACGPCPCARRGSSQGF